MVRFIAVYEGPSIAEARLVAVTSDPRTLSAVSSNLLGDGKPQVSTEGARLQGEQDKTS